MSEEKEEEKTAEEKKTEAIENNQPRPQKTAEPIDKPADLEKMVALFLRALPALACPCTHGIWGIHRRRQGDPRGH